ncbi:Transcriptional repressor EZH1 [Phytophthora cinnamomi]|uniref:Transcriptional repressor EZH1 n=1 Tax=Phytophthora cinnamomi TaxID=4785 RepID=UPI00355A3EE0|nr:Transcriptional repressor EZH1 [Phytophthora cinnamomi]
MYAREPITANEFVYEYAGATLSQDEAERRGLIYDKMEMSYLFDLNEDAVLDALRSGNKSNIWALRDITVGEELVFDYGYKRSVGPDWSQRRTASKDTS